MKTKFLQHETFGSVCVVEDDDGKIYYDANAVYKVKSPNDAKINGPDRVRIRPFVKCFKPIGSKQLRRFITMDGVNVMYEHTTSRMKQRMATFMRWLTEQDQRTEEPQVASNMQGEPVIGGANDGGEESIIALQLQEQGRKMAMWLDKVALRVNEAHKLIHDLRENNRQLHEEIKRKENAMPPENIERLKEAVAVMRPIYVAYMQGRSLYCASYVGQIFGLTAQQLNTILETEGVQRKDKKNGKWYLTKDYIDKGFGLLVPTETPDGDLIEQLKWTQRGILLIESIVTRKGFKRLASTKDGTQEFNFNI